MSNNGHQNNWLK